MTFGGTVVPGTQAEALTIETVRFTGPPSVESLHHQDVSAALAKFVGGMADADAETVWMYASEEDQAAFETEEAIYAAFAETFPVLTQTREVTIESIRDEGDTPFVALRLIDAAGDTYSADIGFWLDDAGDWKVVSCEIRSTAERIAALF